MPSPAIPAADQTAFEAFVSDFGKSELAAGLGVGIHSVYHYLRGSRHVSLARRTRILELAAGRLTSADIDAHYLKRLNGSAS